MNEPQTSCFTTCIPWEIGPPFSPFSKPNMIFCTILFQALDYLCLFPPYAGKVGTYFSSCLGCAHKAAGGTAVLPL